ncbi:uncharacterized protein LOC128855673 [Anastrepha ludens]|uniref:uncharacterized protein LOC128855673 n=1 Tax=Anastrepha ludens TaxID=28586 RepID=UPI0023B0F114|nr:uncharacterized protein LOC128855673 [Anastrepha ludens]XP_053946741.1 uncharacterized protein LOC128855673 [Anastrepha ludens]XP_053946742.1 uncharacterized protein LOC128855673 [Anastrepha ludens]XP_053946743.1 uncharacterized protein LOC128855673 [Anastrepha ludens]XP_053946744.1 uncharacterized protein LOC128855673 [Anastrepha ludens]XP_053946745.1 uncharacterized protein LOC128855673 [Anastrepha ludens]XP_053946746.1 uncharacterized protein LOC128855673 [Anastrepha ludens]
MIFSATFTCKLLLLSHILFHVYIASVYAFSAKHVSAVAVAIAATVATTTAALNAFAGVAVAVAAAAVFPGNHKNFLVDNVQEFHFEIMPKLQHQPHHQPQHQHQQQQQQHQQQQHHHHTSTHHGEYPLPNGWDIATDFDGKTYYIDHNTKKTTWLDPRDRYVAKLTPKRNMHTSIHSRVCVYECVQIHTYSHVFGCIKSHIHTRVWGFIYLLRTSENIYLAQIFNFIRFSFTVRYLGLLWFLKRSIKYIFCIFKLPRFV